MRKNKSESDTKDSIQVLETLLEPSNDKEMSELKKLALGTANDDQMFD